MMRRVADDTNLGKFSAAVPSSAALHAVFSLRCTPCGGGTDVRGG